MLHWLNCVSMYTPQFIGFLIVITILWIVLSEYIDNIDIMHVTIWNIIFILILSFLLMVSLVLMALATRQLL